MEGLIVGVGGLSIQGLMVRAQQVATYSDDEAIGDDKLNCKLTTQSAKSVPSL